MKKQIAILVLLFSAFMMKAQYGSLGRITISSSGSNDSRLSVTMGEPLAGSYVSTDGKTILTVGGQSGSYQNVADTLSLSTQSINLASEGNNISVDLKSNRSWLITNPENWLTFSQMTGTKNATLNISITKNTGSVARVVKILVQAGTISEILTIHQDGSVGVAPNIALDEIKIFPNPVSSELNIDFGSYVNEPIKVSIIDLNGKVLFEEISSTKEFKVPVIGLTEGSYILWLKGTQNNFTKTYKFTKTNN